MPRTSPTTEARCAPEDLPVLAAAYWDSPGESRTEEAAIADIREILSAAVGDPYATRLVIDAIEEIGDDARSTVRDWWMEAQS